MTSQTTPDRDTLSDRIDRFRHWPTLTYHYGIGPTELAQMPRWLLDVYREELDSLMAVTELSALHAASYPHLEKDRDRRDVLDGLRDRIEAGWVGRKATAPKDLTPAMAAAQAGAAGLGMTFVGPDGQEVTDA